MGRHRAGIVPERMGGATPAGTAGQGSLFEPLETAGVQQVEVSAEERLFKVLFVCTGNIHRSVMGERLMRSRVRPGWPVAVRSAGTQAVVDHPIGEYSAIALKELGGNPEGHKARQLVTPVAASADLILTAEVAHRQIILLETPAALRRTFSLLEFARLAEQVEPLKLFERLDIDAVRAQVLQVSAQRGLARQPTQPEDIADPVGATLKETRQRARQVAECVDIVIGTLGLGNASP
jgi:protein-tyrosine phosphatase